jgi:hypothetical protein
MKEGEGLCPSTPPRAERPLEPIRWGASRQNARQRLAGDYRHDGTDRQRTMTLGPDEFVRRFLLHVLDLDHCSGADVPQ